MSAPRKKLIHKLKNKYRLVILNDQTIEEKFSFVDVPADLASQIVKAMAGNVVRGKKVKVEMA